MYLIVIEQIFVLFGLICYKHTAVILHDPVNFLIITASVAT